MLAGLRAAGRCILFSSHVMQEVAALCDRVVVIGAGRVLADASPEEMRRQTGAASLEGAFLQVLGSADGVG
jgi:sodium transport system ATP-binding protein